MRYLIDTHVLLWQLLADPRLTQNQRAVITDEPDVWVSHVSLIEIAIKRRKGRLDVDLAELEAEILAQSFEMLPIKAAHIARLAELPRHHGDPFDGLLIAQAQAEGLTLVSSDGAFAMYDVQLVR